MKTSFLDRLMHAVCTFDAQPMVPPLPPDRTGIDPLTGAVRVVMWRASQVIYAVSPDGLVLGIIRYIARLVAVLAVPLLGFSALLVVVELVMAQLGGILTSTLGVGLILLAVAVVVGRIMR